MRNRTKVWKSKWLMKILSFTLVLGLISQGFAGAALAKETRAAIVSSVEGTVMVTKAGGSNAYRAFEEMSLSQGDHIKTESGSSIVLLIVDQEDEITIGPDSDLYISSLMQTDSSAKKSKLKMWAGSVWFKVKKLVSSEDEFEVDTPTAVMGVRGSNGYIQSVNGQIYALMTSGILEAQSGDSSSPTPIYPGQQITLMEDENTDEAVGPTALDIALLIEVASPKVLEQMIKSIQAIQEENEQFIQDIKDGKKAVDPKSDLNLTDLSVLDKVRENLDNLVGNIVKKAIEENKLDKNEVQKLIDQANANRPDDKKFDLDKVKPLDSTAGTDPLKEKAKKEALEKKQQEKIRKQEEAKKQLEEKQKQHADLLKKIEDERKKKEEETKKLQDEQKKKLEELYKQQLDEAAKAKFEAEKAKLQQQQQKQEEDQKKNQEAQPSNP
ncbi:MAG: hypothetical protein K0R67_1323, partial [Paenibacillus sp.]|nr:hypothetical protein [Paenibacillus sp.]